MLTLILHAKHLHLLKRKETEHRRRGMDSMGPILLVTQLVGLH